MGDDKKAEHQSALFDTLGQFGDLVATMLGMVNQLTSNGWTEEQARDIVAYMFGWRPRDGSKLEGTD